jgi:two-component system OmpR family response regulator
MYEPAPKRVLIVDDEPAIRDLLAQALSAAGHTVRTAATGREARQIGAGGPFDVVLLDCDLPDTTGPALHRHLARAGGCRAAPVYFMSGRSRPEPERTYIARHGRGFFQKPFDVADLIASL